MRFLVVGGGSMGKRRTRCLLANNVPKDQIELVDTREDRRAEVNELLGVNVHASLEDGMATGPDAVIVSVPGAYHMAACLVAARAGKHFFSEVPLSIDLEGTEELLELVKGQSLVAAPGTQPPFHPLVKQAKAWMEDPAFGKLLMINEAFGSYLPGWHPYEDYREFYASRQGMGGGNLDVVAQEQAALYWLIGDRVQRVIASGKKLSTLEIEGSDCWQLIGETAGGVTITQWFDMVQRDAQSLSRYISEAGTVEVNIRDGYVRRFLAETGQWERVTPPAGFVYEQCYIDEIALFIRCIRDGDTWHNPIETAIDVIKYLLAIQQSDKTRAWVEV